MYQSRNNVDPNLIAVGRRAACRAAFAYQLRNTATTVRPDILQRRNGAHISRNIAPKIVVFHSKLSQFPELRKSRGHVASQSIGKDIKLAQVCQGSKAIWDGTREIVGIQKQCPCRTDPKLVQTVNTSFRNHRQLTQTRQSAKSSGQRSYKVIVRKI
jgi:hypothetical protein